MRSPAAEEDEETSAALTWQRRALEALLVLALAAVGTGVWLILRPAEKAAPPEPVVEVRMPSDDPAVEIYFTPSQPEALSPVQEDSTPLPVEPVSLDELFGRDGR